MCTSSVILYYYSHVPIHDAEKGLNQRLVKSRPSPVKNRIVLGRRHILRRLYSKLQLSAVP